MMKAEMRFMLVGFRVRLIGYLNLLKSILDFLIPTIEIIERKVSLPNRQIEKRKLYHTKPQRWVGNGTDPDWNATGVFLYC
jgi:hypothetical protein